MSRLPTQWAPLCALLLLACAPDTEPSLDPADAFRALHEPVYGVYALGADRGAIHDLLAASFTGEALTREYVEHFTTLARMEEESTSIQVLAVDYEEVTVLDSEAGRVRVDADWSVGGVVTHRGHRHPRTNRYRAIYTLEAVGETVGEGWRIVDTRMRDMERIESYDSIVGDDGDGEGGVAKSRRGLMSPLDMLKAGLDEDVRRAAEERERQAAEERERRAAEERERRAAEERQGEADGAEPDPPAEENP